MKRTELKRKTPLKSTSSLGRGAGLSSDPAKTQEWQDRSRKPLDPGTRKKRKHIPDPIRARVYKRSRGWCIACLHRTGLDPTTLRPSRLRANGVREACQVHHVYPVQLFPDYELEECNMVGLCAECHASHEKPGVNDGRLAYAALPEEVRVWAYALDEPDRYYILNDRNYRQ